MLGGSKYISKYAYIHVKNKIKKRNYTTMKINRTVKEDHELTIYPLRGIKMKLWESIFILNQNNGTKWLIWKNKRMLINNQKSMTDVLKKRIKKGRWLEEEKMCQQYVDARIWKNTVKNNKWKMEQAKNTKTEGKSETSD